MSKEAYCCEFLSIFDFHMNDNMASPAYESVTY